MPSTSRWDTRSSRTDKRATCVSSDGSGVRSSLTLGRVIRTFALSVDDSPSEPCVTYRGADGQPLVYALGRGPVTVGRSSSADICLSWDALVSRMHARLELVGDDPASDWTVVDDGSSRNGSYVNGERIRGRAHLREGDALSVGATLLVFRVGRMAAGDSERDGPRAQPGSTLSNATIFERPHVTRTSLSDTQYRVLVALAGRSEEAQPATDEEIGARLFLNVNTVRAHLQVLFERFGVATLAPDRQRAAVVALARAGGLLPERERER
jgi:DNA-binding CsgD family transcriptional regulator